MSAARPDDDAIALSCRSAGASRMDWAFGAIGGRKRAGEIICGVTLQIVEISGTNEEQMRF
jgi:hypothetical protein